MDEEHCNPVGWAHLAPDELRLLNEMAADPETWIHDEEFQEPIIGWLVVFPKEDTLAELVFRDEVAARSTAATIQDAVVSAFSTPDVTWHRWEVLDDATDAEQAR